MSKHTPGPWMADYWRYDITQNIRIRRLGERPEETVAVIIKSDDPVFEIMNEANAQLIASAPDHALMLSVLATRKAHWVQWDGGTQGEFCMDGLRLYTTLDEFGCPQMTEPIRAAIAKAEGTEVEQRTN